VIAARRIEGEGKREKKNWKEVLISRGTEFKTRKKEGPQENFANFNRNRDRLVRGERQGGGSRKHSSGKIEMPREKGKMPKKLDGGRGNRRRYGKITREPTKAAGNPSSWGGIVLHRNHHGTLGKACFLVAEVSQGSSTGGEKREEGKKRRPTGEDGYSPSALFQWGRLERKNYRSLFEKKRKIKDEVAKKKKDRNRGTRRTESRIKKRLPVNSE